MGALSSGVSGLQAHQKMLDITGNNLANVNTTAFKASRILFSELLSETVKQASQPGDGLGGTNPQQIGSGVGVSNISPNLTPGNISETGSPLDLAIQGNGYFILNNGQQNVYTRAGAFAVDADNMLVDPATGYRVQRIGTVGEAEGFQTVGNNGISVPYGAPMEARATSEIDMRGNLSSDGSLEVPQTQILTSNMKYNLTDGTTAGAATNFVDLAQFDATGFTSGALAIDGITRDGTSFADALTAFGAGDPANLNFSIDATTTLGDFVDHLNNNVLIGDNGTATASLVNGQVRITDSSSGYSQLDLSFSYTGDGSFQTPNYFEMSSVGGSEVKNYNISVFDSQGGEHQLSGSFVRTDQPNTWDMVLSSMTGNVDSISMADRRISGVTFNAVDGSFAGISGGGSAEFSVAFGHDPANPQTFTMNLGTPGQFNGITQFSGSSTAVAMDQNGYQSGSLTGVSINNEGTVIGSFSNGQKKEVASVGLATFQNPAALESQGGGYFLASANSGSAVESQALMGSAGSIRGGALEKSNADVASEFVNLIQAQNGFQANARTIKIANEVLKELTNLIR